MSATDDTAAVLPELLAELRALRAQVSRLAAQVAALEGKARAELEAAAALAPPSPAPPAAPAEDEGLPEDVLLVISAAVAAFLGKRARVRGVRVLSSASWAHQGRVSIQASHALSPQH
jgi:methylmalonyl-CoA carboxyltransferase large subunit